MSLPNVLRPMNVEMIGKVQRVQDLAAMRPQINISVEHSLHGGLYNRTIKIPADVMICGALVKIKTSLVLSGHAFVYTGERWVEHRGYHVLRGYENRKQIFLALTDTYLTMFFPTQVKTVKEAEEQFTDEYDLLQTRRN